MTIRLERTYGGANGNKISLMINGELYMLKLPSHAPKNDNLSYANSCVSEYIGSHIFKQESIVETECKCPHCNSINFIKYGKRNEYQCYIRKECKKNIY